MSNLFKKGFASLALASAMASSVFAGSAAFIDLKVKYANTSKTDSKDGNVTAFKMHIEEGNLVATFGEDANHVNSAATIKLAVKKTVAGDGIKGANIVFKQATASGENLMPSNLDKKIAKLTFTFSQRGRENLLIISALTKEDLVNAMPLNATVNRIDKKMHLAITTDKIGLKEKDAMHFFTKNVVWKKENQLLGNYSSEKQNAMTPQMNIDLQVLHTPNLLTNDYGQSSEAEKGNLLTANLFAAVNNVIPNVATTNTNQRKIVFEPLTFNFNRATNDNMIKNIHEPYKIVSVFSGAILGDEIKTIEPYNVSVLGGAANKIKTYVDKKKTLYVYDNDRTHEKHISLNPASFHAKAEYGNGITIPEQNMQKLFSFNSGRFLNVNNLGNNTETHATNLVSKGLTAKSGTWNAEKTYMIGQSGANRSTAKKHFDSMAA